MPIKVFKQCILGQSSEVKPFFFEFNLPNDLLVSKLLQKRNNHLNIFEIREDYHLTMRNLNDEKEQITVPGIRNDMSIHDVEELILQETEEFD